MEEQVFWVKPRYPLAPSKVLLPACEQIGVNIILRRLECFLVEDDFDEKHFINAAQEAVAGLIAEIPLLAGHVILEDGVRKGVIPEDPKCQIRVVRHDISARDDLAKCKWAPHALEPADYCLTTIPNPGIGSDSFSMQINLLKGGIVLSIEPNHIIADGVSQCDILYVLAHHMGRAVDRLPPKPSGTKPPEALETTTPQGSHPARPLTAWQDWREKDARLKDFTREQIVEYFTSRMERLSMSFWSMPKAKVNQLRQDCSDPSSTGRPLSLQMCLTSLLWGAVTRARRHSLKPDQVTTLITPIQARMRVPELPFTWFGNAIIYGRATATVAELATLSPAEIGRRVNKSIAFWTPERIRELWGSLEEYGYQNLEDVEPDKDTDFGANFELSSVADLHGAQQYNWGSSLTSVASRFPPGSFIDGYCLIFPKDRNGALEFCLFMERTTCRNLMRDGVLTKYCRYLAGGDEEVDEWAKEIESGIEKAKL